jgi:hypothetical protein
MAKDRLARGGRKLLEPGGRGGDPVPGQGDAGEEDLQEDEPVDFAAVLPGELEAPLPLLLRCIEVVPLVQNAPQLVVDLGGDRLGMVAKRP